jgi:alpha-beta hydrolase superfamily lysophospholipase
LNTLTLTAADGVPLFVYQWLPGSVASEAGGSLRSPTEGDRGSSLDLKGSGFADTLSLPPSVGDRRLPALRATELRGVVQIVHGMSEHAGRYAELARALNEAGFAVYAHDQRGHGQTGPELGHLGEGIGWATLLDDIGVVLKKVVEDFPGVPVVLLGHSMGSFLARQFAGENGQRLRGLVLSGAYEESRLMAWGGGLLARVERMRLGGRGHSALIRGLTFDAFNKKFAPNRTRFDWLSRDPAEVDKYSADPLCGFEASVQLWIELLNALAEGLPVPPADLPVCLLMGERDPVCGPDPGGKKLAALFRARGVKRLKHHVYPEARHEVFREENRDEVVANLVKWLIDVVR